MAAFLYQWLLVSSLLLAGGEPPVNNVAASGKEVFHPFYISVTEIDHNAAEKTLEISCKVFVEDPEEIIKKNYKTAVNFAEEKDKVNLEKLVPDYFNRHLQIAVDGKPVKLSFVGFEKEKESVYCFFQVDGVASAKKIDINNSILFDFIDKQINIMHVTVGGKRQSNKLNYPDRSVSFSY